MKIVYLIIGIGLLIGVFYLITKSSRKKYSSRLIKILTKDYYLGQKNQTLDKRKNSVFEKTILEKTINNKHYIATIYPMQRTLKVYEIENNICSGFFILSCEDEYSLPYWKYASPYVDENPHIPITHKYLLVSGLAEYTRRKVFANFDIINGFESKFSKQRNNYKQDTGVIEKLYEDYTVERGPVPLPFFDNELIYKVNDNHYILESETVLDTSQDTNTTYSYLVSKSINDLINFRDIILEDLKDVFSKFDIYY